ncbi:flavin reductase family protein [Mycolicibacterium tokaiense]|uniref:Flavin reductase domain-containing protein n=1 Tax=Mycolicibacterium tokaiense TaxID=39695 RepID=A0A378TEE0_9MYCO|nr:flavin reductase family protein [Mycolicibacterium tokaiense]STZ58547.1 flavin reductase domain-containing protein [Mycolicibacterium tokaiense]
MISGNEFRRALGNFPTGVTVITAATDSGPVGMACNSMTAVSLDPPLVLVCTAHTSETWPLIRATGRFVVNVMANDQAEMTRRFATKGTDRFAAVGLHPRSHGIGLDGALAWIECTIHDEHRAGDHSIVVGRVHELDAPGQREPLLFFRGAFGSFLPKSIEPQP